MIIDGDNNVLPVSYIKLLVLTIDSPFERSLYLFVSLVIDVTPIYALVNRYRKMWYQSANETTLHPSHNL